MNIPHVHRLHLSFNGLDLTDSPIVFHSFSLQYKNRNPVKESEGSKNTRKKKKNQRTKMTEMERKRAGEGRKEEEEGGDKKR